MGFGMACAAEKVGNEPNLVLSQVAAEVRFRDLRG